MQPLTRKFRTTIFWAMVVIFIIGTPILIGYSKGYRLDDALSIIETGGIYLHSDVANTYVYVDGEFAEQNGAFLKNTLVQDLRPYKTYEVWVTRDGYQSWTKRLPVFSNLVTEAHVMMLPTVFEWRHIPATSTVNIVAVPVKNATSSASSTYSTTTQTVVNPEFENMQTFFTSDTDQFAVEVATSTYVTVKGKRLATTTTFTEYRFPTWFEAFASTTALAKKTMVRERDGIVAWLDHGDLYATWGRRNEQLPYYFCTATCTKMLIIDWAEPITRYEFYPNRSDAVILGTERGVYAVELDMRSQRNIQPFVEAPGLEFRVTTDGALAIFDGIEFRETSW